MLVCFPKEARAEFSAASSKAGKSLFSLFAALVAVAGLALCHSAYASAFTVTSATSGSTTTFTVTRDSADASETVLYRTVSRTALDGPLAQSVTATFDTSLVTEKFIKAKIEPAGE